MFSKLEEFINCASHFGNSFRVRVRLVARVRIRFGLEG